jgi:DNA-formamidopyrimidine glycosylase
MPEGPEVLEYFNYIKPLLLKQQINKIKCLSGKYEKTPPENWQKLQNILSRGGSIVSDVMVKGKTIFIEIKNEDTFIWLSFTHGMTGWWEKECEKHSRIVFELSNTKLYYNDTRNFGKMSIYGNKNEFTSAIEHLGPDVLGENMNYNSFYSRIDKKPKSKIGAVLLDQKLVAGIGNYMRCDILWSAKLHYTRTIGSLNQIERLDLYNAVKNACSHYLNCKNIDESDDYFFIYYKDTDLYGNLVKRTTWLGRTIHYVDWGINNVQKLGF